MPRDRGLGVEVAGIVFDIRGARAAAVRWARERYAPFLTTRRPHLTLSVRHRAWPTGGPGKPRAAWNGDRFEIVLPGCRIEGNLARRRAVLTSPDLVSAVSPSALRALVSLLLLRKGGFLIHASAVLDGDRAWVFSGPSESGKTTLARQAGDRAVLNDETVAIVPARQGYVAAATPFFGEGGSEMARVHARGPIGAMFFLKKAAGFAHRPAPPGEAVARCWSQVFVPKRDPVIVDALLDALVRFTARTPCFELAFAPTPEVWAYVARVA